MSRLIFCRSRGQASRSCSESFLFARKGAVAVEFALVSVVFFGVLFALIEIALILFYESGVHNGLRLVSRQIETGDLDISDTTATSTVFCSVAFVPNCDAANVLNLDIQPLDRSTSNTGTRVWLDDGGSLWSGINVAAGLSGGDPVIIRAWFSHAITLPLLQTAFDNHPSLDNQRLIGGIEVSVVAQ